ncbi:MAG: M50 family metallopeptidase [Patescibacteria group bacterium]
MLLTTIVFIAVLSVLVFVHELGHFWTARKFGVKAEEFGFGFPPRFCGWKKVNGKRKFFLGNKNAEEINSEDTIYSLNWVPLGGFVKIKGEDGEGKSDPDSFANKKIWQRSIILSAGVAMNVVLCMVALSLAFMIGAPQILNEKTADMIVKDQKINVVSVLKGSPAAKAKLQLGDVVLNIDGQSFSEIEQIQKYIAAKDKQAVVIEVQRLDEKITATITPEILTETKLPGLGVGLASTGIVSYPWYLSIWHGIRGTFFMAIQIIVAFATLIKNAVIGQPLGVDVSGPVGIAVMTGQVARMGFVYILQFTALLSLNLAIINFLPFPALDGGRVLFLIIEKIRRRAINQKIEQIVHSAGFALLILLIFVVTGRDIFKFKDVFINIWQKIVG